MKEKILLGLLVLAGFLTVYRFLFDKSKYGKLIEKMIGVIIVGVIVAFFFIWN